MGTGCNVVIILISQKGYATSHIRYVVRVSSIRSTAAPTRTGSALSATRYYCILAYWQHSHYLVVLVPGVVLSWYWEAKWGEREAQDLAVLFYIVQGIRQACGCVWNVAAGWYFLSKLDFLTMAVHRLFVLTCPPLDTCTPAHQGYHYGSGSVPVAYRRRASPPQGPPVMGPRRVAKTLRDMLEWMP